MTCTHVEPVDQVEDQETGGEDNTGHGINQSSLGDSNAELLPESRSWFDILDFITYIFHEFLYHGISNFGAGVGSSRPGHEDEDPGVLKDGKKDEKDADNSKGINVLYFGFPTHLLNENEDLN